MHGTTFSQHAVTAGTGAMAKEQPPGGVHIVQQPRVQCLADEGIDGVGDEARVGGRGDKEGLHHGARGCLCQRKSGGGVTQVSTSQLKKKSQMMTQKLWFHCHMYNCGLLFVSTSQVGASNNNSALNALSSLGQG